MFVKSAVSLKAGKLQKETQESSVDPSLHVNRASVSYY